MKTQTFEEVPLRGMRGMIADKMQASLANTAQLTHHAEANVQPLLDRKSALAEEGVRVSMEDLFIEAVVQTLGRHPHMNGLLQDRVITQPAAIHLSIAIALPGNLLAAPTIFDAQDLSLAELRERRQDLATRAKSNKLTVREMTGGTFTVSNLGLSRVHHFTPILNAPQLGILGIGCAQQKPVIDENGDFTIAPFVGLSLTFDHRAVDGAPAADFLTDICAQIEGNA